MPQIARARCARVRFKSIHLQTNLDLSGAFEFIAADAVHQRCELAALKKLPLRRDNKLARSMRKNKSLRARNRKLVRIQYAGFPIGAQVVRLF